MTVYPTGHALKTAKGSYDIWVADGEYFLHDPGHRLPHPHVSLTHALSGMGDQTADMAVQTAAMAANFIPGIGSIISGVLGIGESLFGGGDPTPLGDIYSQMIALYSQVQTYQKALGLPPLPTPKSAGDRMVALGFSLGDQQAHRRDDVYAAVAKLQNMVADLKQQAISKSSEGDILSQILPYLQRANVPAPVPTLPATAPYIMSLPPVAAAVPSGVWILGGLAAIVAVGMMANR